MLKLLWFAEERYKELEKVLKLSKPGAGNYLIKASLLITCIYFKRIEVPWYHQQYTGINGKTTTSCQMDFNWSEPVYIFIHISYV